MVGKATFHTVWRIAVLCGGHSAERAISLQSGSAVAAALRRRGHRVTLLDPAASDLDAVDFSAFDAAFLALHGAEGEDGRMQAYLQARHVPFTGSDAATCRVAISKSASKERFAQEGVPTPPYVLIHETDSAERIERLARQIGYPMVVKPDTQGSSFGVSLVDEPSQLPQALTRCFHLDAFGVLERAIAGSEWTVGFLDRMPLPPIRIETPHPFFDYRAKYEDATTRYFVQAPPFGPEVEAIQQAAFQAREALGTRGLARVDLRVDSASRPWVLEVNTTPGMTDHSLIPMAAESIGLDLGRLCEAALKSAMLAGRPRRAQPRQSAQVA